MAVLKRKKWLFVVLVVGILFWAAPSISLAVEKQWLFGLIDPQVFPYKLQVPLGNISSVDSEGDVSALGVYISELYKFFVSAAAIVAVVSIMFAGLQRITSQGNPEMISKSNEQITQALFGLAIALLSYVILNTINPQLLRLDALDIDVVDYSAISVAGGAGSLCPSYQLVDGSWHQVTCGNKQQPLSGAHPSPECWGLSRTSPGNAGLDEVCEVQSGGNFSREVQTVRLSRMEEGRVGAELITALHDAGWYDPPPFGLMTGEQVIYSKWCPRSDVDPDKQSTERCVGGATMPCGRIQYVGAPLITMNLVKTYEYYLGTYCPTVKGVRPSCVINLSQVTFTPFDPSDIGSGTIGGAGCQTID